CQHACVHHLSLLALSLSRLAHQYVLDCAPHVADLSLYVVGEMVWSCFGGEGGSWVWNLTPAWSDDLLVTDSGCPPACGSSAGSCRGARALAGLTSKLPHHACL